jgi:hypothetical protein
MQRIKTVNNTVNNTVNKPKIIEHANTLGMCQNTGFNQPNDEPCFCDSQRLATQNVFPFSQNYLAYFCN